MKDNVTLNPIEHAKSGQSGNVQNRPKEHLSGYPIQVSEALLIHSRALAAHCECLAMNAEDCAAIVMGSTPPYTAINYAKVLEKWKIIDEEGKPLI